MVKAPSRTNGRARPAPSVPADLQTCGDDRRVSPSLGGGIGTRKPGTLRSAPANVCKRDCGDGDDQEENAAEHQAGDDRLVPLGQNSAAQKKPSMTRAAAPAIAH